jgi:hypothetical protein
MAWTCFQKLYLHYHVHTFIYSGSSAIVTERLTWITHWNKLCVLQMLFFHNIVQYQTNHHINSGTKPYDKTQRNAPTYETFQIARENLKNANFKKKNSKWCEVIKCYICPKTAVQEERERRERGDLSQVNWPCCTTQLPFCMAVSPLVFTQFW